MGKQKGFFFSQVVAFSWCGEKGKNFSKINVRNSSSVSIGCLKFFHISSWIMLAYLPLSWGWCFFSGEILPFLEKEIVNYYFSSVNLTKFANFSLNFTKLSISKKWEKKNTVEGFKRSCEAPTSSQPQLVQPKEGNCFCDHVLAWSLTNSMRFFFVFNTFSIPEL